MVQPLTKRTKEGKRYTRPRDIEATIAGALGQDLEALEARAAISKSGDPRYLPSEVLVHLIRHALRHADERAYNSLLNLLFHRCMINLYKYVPDDQHFDAGFARAEVIGRLGELFGDDAGTPGAAQLDFYEIRFNRAFSKLRIDVVRAEAAKAKSEEPLLEIDDVSEDEFDEGVLARLSQAFRSPSDPGCRPRIRRSRGRVPFTMSRREPFAARIPSPNRSGCCLSGTRSAMSESIALRQSAAQRTSIRRALQKQRP